MRLPVRRLACAWSAVLWATPAAAVESRVGLELQGCTELSESSLREHLDLELATLALSEVTARLVLRCEPGAVAIELYRASGERYAIAARVELRDTAKAARERLVALAATELLAQAERAEQPLPVAPAETAPALPVKAEQPRVAPAAGRRIELFLAVNAALQGVPGAALWGGSLGTRWGLGRSWSLLLDTRFERGDESLHLASVRWTSLSGFVGAGATTDVGPLRLALGLGGASRLARAGCDGASPGPGAKFDRALGGLGAAGLGGLRGRRRAGAVRRRGGGLRGPTGARQRRRRQRAGRATGTVALGQRGRRGRALTRPARRCGAHSG